MKDRCTTCGEKLERVKNLKKDNAVIGDLLYCISCDITFIRDFRENRLEPLKDEDVTSYFQKN